MIQLQIQHGCSPLQKVGLGQLSTRLRSGDPAHDPGIDLYIMACSMSTISPHVVTDPSWQTKHHLCQKRRCAAGTSGSADRRTSRSCLAQHMQHDLTWPAARPLTAETALVLPSMCFALHQHSTLLWATHLITCKPFYFPLMINQIFAAKAR